MKSEVSPELIPLYMRFLSPFECNANGNSPLHSLVFDPPYQKNSILKVNLFLDNLCPQDIIDLINLKNKDNESVIDILNMKQPFLGEEKSQQLQELLAAKLNKAENDRKQLIKDWVMHIKILFTIYKQH